MVLLCHLADND